MKLIWLIVAILFAVAELMTTTLTLIWFSIGAVILIFLSSIIDSILIQIIIFAIISTLMLTIATKKCLFLLHIVMRIFREQLMCLRSKIIINIIIIYKLL